ncbi:MAG: ABC transporter ATP-binding protein [Muribaculaceae bacterium]|nr:ABC transporter ATP-binding protein [Muribaculaceae bacterium]
MLSARNIHKSFGALEVLKGIDLDIAPGKVTAIVGPSGAGKTTLLQILGTLMSPDAEGKILYGDSDITKLSDAKLSDFRNKNIGFVFQFHQLLPEFSLVENVAMPALIAGKKRSEAFDEARKLLKRLSLDGRDDHRPDELSGGECQRAAVARALINHPSVVFADEPSGSLDSQNRKQLHRLFFELRDSIGATFVIVTHDESLAADADVIVRMVDGVINKIENK